MIGSTKIASERLSCQERSLNRPHRAGWQDWVENFRGKFGWKADFAVSAGTSDSNILGADPDFLRTVPGAIATDNRPGSPPSNIYWAGDAGQAAQFVQGYASVWLPATLLGGQQRAKLVAAL
jgi:hypothetical protein